MFALLNRACFVPLLFLGMNLLAANSAYAEKFALADGAGWPGAIWEAENSNVRVLWTRAITGSDQVIPRVRSLTWLPDGRLVFCSGLDRSVMVLDQGQELQLHHGGGLVRQVRTDTNGDLYWSGLETPIDNNPLPDGFIYRYRPSTGETETVATFSQNDVGRDWWGALDVQQGKIFVATHQHPTRIYQLEDSRPRLRLTLPIAATGFRWEPSGALLVTDGQGKLIRYRDPEHLEQAEIVVDLGQPFVDFSQPQ